MNSTLKLFLKLAIVFVVLYFFLDFLTFAYIKTNYSTIENYVIEVNTPKIEITDCKATYMNGYVKGKITNNTGEEIDKIYIKINCYSERDNDLGTKYARIENLKQGETQEFEIKFRFQEVKSIKINVTKEAVINTEEGTTMFSGFTGIALLLAGLILLRYVP